MQKFIKKTGKILLYAGGVLVILALCAIATGYFLLRGSLPQVDGTVKFTSLSAPVTIERDSLGIPTIKAANRIDVARAVGFVHAQDRFFQMDLMRRAAAGELSELFGCAAIDYDKQRRRHQFRKRTREVMGRMSAEEMALLQAYAEGVNSGLETLQVRPFEYLFLQVKPSPWKPEDALLVSYGLFFELQESEGKPDLIRGYMHALLPKNVYDFFVNNGSAWESALDGSHRPMLPIPSAEDFAYLKGYNAKKSHDSAITDALPVGGSNNWAATGSRTADGKAIVACDMHLRLAVPNIWYRAAYIYNDGNGNPVNISGATLPGAPCMVIGSNGNIAWGWTNSFVDTTDLVALTLDKEDPDNYISPKGKLAFEKEIELINVKGKEPIPFEIRQTIWGPVSGQTFFDKPLAIQWIAHQPDALNLQVVALETAKSLDEALQVIHNVKSPLLNFVVADSNGHVGWTLAGAIPKRKGFDGTIPISSDDPASDWEGAVDPAQYPVIRDPMEEYVWTANNRVLGDKWAHLMNQEGYINGIRAHQIEKTLQTTKNATPRDMLAIQMDTQGRFLERWQGLLLSTIQSAKNSSDLSELKDAVSSWDHHSSHNSPGYYWIRRFREITMQHVLARFLFPCFDAWPDITHSSRDFEEPVWMLVSQQPEYLINTEFGSWNQELASYIQKMLKLDLPENGSVNDVTWSKKSLLKMQHPFSKVMPALSEYLDMPHEPMSGDFFMPKVAGPNDGASQRMVVSPGNESSGIFHAPGGQSGHPLSVHYRDAHAAWVNGEASPFLPGDTVETLTLKP